MKKKREIFKRKNLSKIVGKNKYIVQLEHLLKLGCQMGMDWWKDNNEFNLEKASDYYSSLARLTDETFLL